MLESLQAFGLRCLRHAADQIAVPGTSEAVAPNQTFDEGNTKVVNLLREVMEGVADRIRRSEQRHPAGGFG